ncbi:MAG: dynamin family protein [Selenomonadaceae bacterium]|nr:dynamin family protein [Selenomonadaceae bacterium]
MGKIICGKCRFENRDTRNFCEKCGTFLRTKDFDKNAYELPEVKMMRVVENLLHVPHEPINWDAVIDAYSAKVERFDALFKIPGMGAENNSAVVQKMSDFLSLCRNPDFQIAFVGTIKTGKSTLINALLGKNYASMAVTPETAALTKFRSSPRDYVKIIFYTQSEWTKLWNSRTSGASAFMAEYEELQGDKHKDKWINHAPIHKELANEEIEDELKIWSSSKRAEHYFVKEIEVGISTLGKDFPPQVVFVDTPGLSDPVAYRSELTKGYIRRANAVFVCIDAQKIQKEEIDTIASVFAFSSDNKSKVHIVATHWDVLNDPEDDWREQKKYLVKRLTGPAFFDMQATASTNIMHSAAYIYNLCRDYDSLDKKGLKSLKKFALDFDYELPQDLRAMQKKANVETILRVIRENLAARYKRLLTNEIEKKFLDIKYNLTRTTKEKKDSTEELLKASRSSGKELEKQLQEQLKRCDAVKNSTEQLKAIIEQVKDKTDKRAKKICDSLRKKLNTPGK